MTDQTLSQATPGQRTLAERAARKTILTLAWPVVAELLLQTLTQMVDMIMVARLGSAAVAAVGLSSQPLFVAFGLFIGIGTGTTALVARYVGAREEGKVEEVVRQSFWIALSLALVVAVAALAFSRQIVTMMGAAPDVVPFGVNYLRWLAPGYVLMLWSMVMTSALRGAGDTRTPMKVNILINLINVIGNYALIYGHFGLPALGVAGAAIATSLSRAVGGFIYLVVLIRGRGPVRLPLARLHQVDFSVIGRILRIGVPTALERVILSFGLIFFSRIVASLGTAAFAAHTIAINAESISFMPAMGFATAATTLVGQNLGAKNPEAAARNGWESAKIGGLVMGVMGLIFFLFPTAFMRLYTNEADVIRLGATSLRIIAVAQIPMAVAFIVSGALRGAGDTRPMMYITGFCVWVVRLGFTYIFVGVLGLGLTGAWLAMAIDWVGRGIFAALRFHSGKWKEIKV
jgi:putative MATE family efflux protein